MILTCVLHVRTKRTEQLKDLVRSLSTQIYMEADPEFIETDDEKEVILEQVDSTSDQEAGIVTQDIRSETGPSDTSLDSGVGGSPNGQDGTTGTAGNNAPQTIQVEVQDEQIQRPEGHEDGLGDGRHDEAADVGASIEEPAHADAPSPLAGSAGEVSTEIPVERN